MMIFVQMQSPSRERRPTRSQENTPSRPPTQSVDKTPSSSETLAANGGSGKAKSTPHEVLARVNRLLEVLYFFALFLLMWLDFSKTCCANCILT